MEGRDARVGLQDGARGGLKKSSRTALVTGSSGLIGSEVVDFYLSLRLERPWRRQQHARGLLRPGGDTRWNQQRLARDAARASCTTSSTSAIAPASLALVEAVRPDVDRPHRRAAVPRPRRRAIPFDDFDVNAVGTLNLLEARAAGLPGVAVRAHDHQQGLRRRARTSIALRGTRDALGLRRPGSTPHGIPKTFSIDQSQALALRRVEGRRRRDGAGIRPLLRHADLLPARRLPDRAEPLRRRAARLPQLPGQVQPRRARHTRSSATRASRCATTSTRTMSRASSHAFVEAPRAGRGLQPRRRQGQLRARSSRRSTHRGAITGKRR